MRILCYAVATAALAGFAAQAQVPPDIEAGLKKIGQIVDPPCTAKLYRPLMPPNDINSNVTPLYPGITIARDVSFGPNPKDVLDVFTADKGKGGRPVLMYVAGGAGNKIEQQDREANAFYDNIMRWATKNGMVGVNMQRHGGPDWDSGGKDVSLMVQWVEANIAKYKGNPGSHVHLGAIGGKWARRHVHRATGIVGAEGRRRERRDLHVGTVQYSSADGGRVRQRWRTGRSGHSRQFRHGVRAAGGCGIFGCGRGQRAGPHEILRRLADAGARGGAPAGRGGPPDAATQLARSSLPELKKTKVKIMIATAELDPGITGTDSPFAKALQDELCKEGKDHCPTLLYMKGESHMSEVFSIDTADTSVSGPILKWIKGIK